MSSAASGMAEGSDSEWSDVDSGQEEEEPQVKEADEKEAQWKDLSGETEDGAAGGDVGDLRIDLGAAKPRRTLSARMGKGKRLRQRRLKGRSKLAKGITKKSSLKRSSGVFRGSTEESSSQGPKRKRMRKKRIRTRDVKVPEEVSSMDTGPLEEDLDKAAKKMRWNRAQVKTFIRRVVQEPEMLSFVLSKAGELPVQGGRQLEGVSCDADGAGNMTNELGEPKMTRATVKKFKEDGKPLHWVLENWGKGIRDKNYVKSLVESTLDEEDGDADYDPTADPEAAALAEEEDDDASIATSSVAGTLTPGKASTPAGPSGGNLNDSLSTPRAANEDDVFKHPSTSKANKEGESSATGDKSQASRCLFQDTLFEGTGGTIPTRSKVSLGDQDIEDLGLGRAGEPPPDAFEDELPDPAGFDMEFLEAIQGGKGEDDDNVDEDPDWAFLDEMETVDDEEYKYNRNFRVPQYEATAIYFDLTQDPRAIPRKKDLSPEVLEEFREQALSTPQPLMPAVVPGVQQGAGGDGSGGVGVPHSATVEAMARAEDETLWLTPEQTAVISLQLKQHIQLLTQMTLVTGAEPAFKHLSTQCKQMTSDVAAATFGKTYSVFSQDNLMPSMNFIDEWEKSGLSALEKPKKPSWRKKAKYRWELSNSLMTAMTESAAFPFPTLLPSKPFDLDSEMGVGESGNAKHVAAWMEAEDHLVALGLEQFSQRGGKDVKKGQNGEVQVQIKKASEFMAGKLVTAKDKNQICKRIKNQKSRKGGVEGNPITHFLTNGSAPRCRIDYHNFLPMNAPDQPLKESLPDTLPDNWLVFLNLPVPPRRRLDLEAANAARDKGEGGDVSSARSGDSSFGAVFSFDPSSGSLAVMNEGVRGGARTHATASSTAVVVGQGEGMDMPNVLGGGGGAEAAPAGPAGDQNEEEEEGAKGGADSLKKERKRILKKYSPMKKKGFSKILPKVPPGGGKESRKGRYRPLLAKPSSPSPPPKDHNPEGEADKNDTFEDANSNSGDAGDFHISDGDTQDQANILDRAMEDCGIFDGNPPPTPATDILGNLVSPAKKSAEGAGVVSEVSIPVPPSQVWQAATCGEDTDVDNVTLPSAIAASFSQEARQGEPQQEEMHQEPIPEEAKSPQDPSVVGDELAGLAGPSSMVKKKTKQQKEAEMTLALLEEEDVLDSDEMKDQDASDLTKMAERELQPDVYCRFLEIMLQYEDDGVGGYCELHNLCTGYVELQEMLLDFLDVDDALRLGNDVYQQYCTRRRQKIFYRKLARYYEGQPAAAYKQVLNKISQLLLEPDLDTATVVAMANRLFKGNQHLHDSFLSLVPEAPFPSSLLPNPEVINFEDLVEQNRLREEGDARYEELPEEDGERVPQQQHQNFLPAPEIITVDPNAVDSEYGGENCPCRCHVHVDKAEEGTHCIHCSLTFINGKVYSRDGRTLRLVRVEYPPGEKPKPPAAGSAAAAGKRRRKKKPRDVAAAASAAAEEAAASTSPPHAYASTEKNVP